MANEVEIDRPVMNVRTAFLARPDVVEAGDGSAISSCPACGRPGAATLAVDDQLICSNGCPLPRIGQALYEWFTQARGGRCYQYTYPRDVS